MSLSTYICYAQLHILLLWKGHAEKTTEKGGRRSETKIYKYVQGFFLFHHLCSLLKFDNS